jgi:UDP-N-acetyl-D-mannosaminuronic acid dehydrogenase
MPLLRTGQTLILRSTVGPGTTEWLAGYIEQRRGFDVGTELYVAHVPERIAVNHFMDEIESLPTIIGGIDPDSGDKAAELFKVFGTEILQTTPVQAELAKTWTNILRYVEFAIPNLLMMNAEQHGANAFEVIDLINHDYPRGGMKKPGLTAGTCLRKDFAFSEERSNAPGMLLAVSRVHESMPLFLVEGLKRRLGGSLRDCKVAVLGLTFKRDSDDMRDSLSAKLIRFLDRELAHVARHDPFVPSETLEEAIAGAQAIVVATNHSAYDGLLERLPQGVLLVDPWNATGAGEVFSNVRVPAQA